MGKQIFISYSHSDERWRERLVTHLLPYARKDNIELFDDRMINPGDDWKNALDQAMGHANVAVLLVSPAYLASDFVANYELPRILERAKEGGMTVAWLPVSASAYKATELNRYQSLIPSVRPLDQMSRPAADKALVEAAKLISGSRTLTDVGRAMQVIDTVYEEVAPEAGLPSGGPVRVQAQHTGTTVAFMSRGHAKPIAVITATALGQLPPEEQLLLQSLEESMRNEFERWTVLRPQRRTLTTRERDDYESAGREMCAELGRILDFVETVVGDYLQDHYAGIRYACTKLVELPT